MYVPIAACRYYINITDSTRIQYHTILGPRTRTNMSLSDAAAIIVHRGRLMYYYMNTRHIHTKLLHFRGCNVD
jgi:hypothetical protein